MQKRAILFDVDGTLVDSNDAHVEAWLRAFAAADESFASMTHVLNRPASLR